MIFETNNLECMNNMVRTDLTFSQSGIVQTNQNWFAKPRYSAFTRLYYVTEGSGVIYSDDETVGIEPGYVYVCPMGMKYGYYGTPTVSKLYFHVNLTLSDSTDIFSHCDSIIKLPCSAEHTYYLEKLYRSSDELDHVLLKGEIFKTVCEAVKKANSSQNHLSDAVNAAINFIRLNLSATLRVEDVAQAVFVSRSKLNDLFKNEIGQQVSYYIDELVMSEALSMLQYSDISISEISDKLGFSDQFYFSRKFKKFFGTTPNKMRKQS